ncbi:uncharacterized protein Z518_01039 [Rhinocladiella mackenziei CBS 650.93]|uniref:Subtelomeric hrmA-associated cluster protein AFUB-079030/YDR124W-like helical bundle domain-containing protein n=1 Tax=Rhinocladiella mackenziei CBS 650.93 TaxID=1442369 RepID=A0A0D2HH28_9EURO|nr:uncharacterized protein Z518_01039 [Rhinocladiella mackenziei CBS 650.93]KIX09958.1 hypothetical protein Z518_01039 [Rhinocladiella mackenziei CBS 650.93]
MTAELNPMSSAGPLPEIPPLKFEKAVKPVATANLSKEAKQQYIINEIKKLLEDSEDFIGLVPGENNIPEILVSPNLEQHKYSILGDACGNFTKYMSDRNPTLRRNVGTSLCRHSKALKQEPERETRIPGGSISYPFQRPTKRHRSRTLNAGSQSKPRVPQSERRLKLVSEAPAAQIRVDDREKLEQWFEEAFLTLQQVACRLVAKVWIKKIHPKKQSTHPYNGQMPRGEPADSNRTRPPYWPPDVIHREPDHIGRDDRTNLLVHLILNTPQPIITSPPDPQNQQTVNARGLFECLELKRSELREDRWEIIQQIIRAREMMEQYEAGEIDGDSLVFLSDYSHGSRMTPNESDNEALEQEGPSQGGSSHGSHEEDLGDEPDLTSTSSTRPSPADQVHLDGRLHLGKLRSSGGVEGSHGRRPAGRRSRSAINGSIATPAIALQPAQEVSSERTMNVRKFKSHVDGSPIDTVMQFPRPNVNQVHSRSGLMVNISQQLPSRTFERDLDSHSESQEMMHVLPQSGPRPPQPGLEIQPWMGMMPDMGPEPPEHIFGIHPDMATQPQEMTYQYLDPASRDMDSRVQNCVSVINPMHYQDYNDGSRRNLPVRVMDTSYPGMLPQQDYNMDMIAGPFYPV